MPDAEKPAIAPAELRELAIQAARLGGQTLLDWQEKFTTREKGPADLVTDADFASQKIVRETLLTARPDDCFLGEESGAEAATAEERQGRVCWVVDPLDGTSNYVHGFPMFATSIAAVLDDQILAAAVFDPLRDEMFSASLGGGASLNDQPLQTTDVEQLGEALAAVSLPPKVRPDSPDLAGFIAVVEACQAIRRTGSAALNLVYVAAGRLDAHWAHVIQPWDAAGGILIVREAGGVVSNSTGGPFDVWKADYLVAATQPLHTAVLEKVKG